MKTLHCDYLVPKKKDWWGAVVVTNHSSIKATSFLSVMEFETGDLIRRVQIDLEPHASTLVSNSHPALADIEQRVRLYLDCNDQVFAKAGNSRGTTNAVTWESMEPLPFPKT